MQAMPQKCAGWRRLPPESLPSPQGEPQAAMIAASPPLLPPGGRVLGRHRRRAFAHADGSDDTGRQEVVLGGERNAVQRPKRRAVCMRAVRSLRSLDRSLGVDLNDGVEHAVDIRDSLDVRLDGLDGRHLAVANKACQLFGRRGGQLS